MAKKRRRRGYDKEMNATQFFRYVRNNYNDKLIELLQENYLYDESEDQFTHWKDEQMRADMSLLAKKMRIHVPSMTRNSWTLYRQKELQLKSGSPVTSFDHIEPEIQVDRRKQKRKVSKDTSVIDGNRVEADAFDFTEDPEEALLELVARHDGKTNLDRMAVPTAMESIRDDDCYEAEVDNTIPTIEGRYPGDDNAWLAKKSDGTLVKLVEA